MSLPLLDVALPDEPLAKLSAAEASSRIYAALHKRYAPPEWAFAVEVYRSTGSHANERRADAVAMELYPSRGLHLEGFEVKASRSDWLRELKNPAKVEQGVFRFCLYWWVVTVTGVVQPGELPSTWGLMVYKGDGRLHADVTAPKLTPEVQPTWGLLGSLLRRLTEGSTPNAAVGAVVEQRVEQRLAQKAEAHALLEAEHRQLVEAVECFEEASGLWLRGGRWRAQVGTERAAQLGAAVKQALGEDRRVDGQLHAMRAVRDHARRVAEECDRQVEFLEAALTPAPPPQDPEVRP